VSISDRHGSRWLLQKAATETEAQRSAIQLRDGRLGSSEGWGMCRSLVAALVGQPRAITCLEGLPSMAGAVLDVGGASLVMTKATGVVRDGCYRMSIQTSHPLHGYAPELLHTRLRPHRTRPGKSSCHPSVSLMRLTRGEFLRLAKGSFS
jgi:hypothetical protein